MPSTQSLVGGLPALGRQAREDLRIRHLRQAGRSQGRLRVSRPTPPAPRLRKTAKYVPVLTSKHRDLMSASWNKGEGVATALSPTHV